MKKLLLVLFAVLSINAFAEERTYYASHNLRFKRGLTPYVIAEILPLNDSVVKIVFRNKHQAETTMYFRRGQSFWLSRVKMDDVQLDDIYEFEFEKDPMISTEGIINWKITVKSFDYNKIVIDEEMLPRY